jgi:hypothetical protein
MRCTVRAPGGGRDPNESGRDAVLRTGSFCVKGETALGNRVRQFSTLAIPSQDRLLYGVSPQPLECGLGLTIGAGTVFPEVNFTLPPITICDGTWDEVKAHYEEMAAQILGRSGARRSPRF